MKFGRVLARIHCLTRENLVTYVLDAGTLRIPELIEPIRRVALRHRRSLTLPVRILCRIVTSFHAAQRLGSRSLMISGCIRRIACILCRRGRILCPFVIDLRRSLCNVLTSKKLVLR